MRFICSILLPALAAGALTGCRPVAEPQSTAQTAALAVSSPYLAAAANDLLDCREPLVVLAQPGMCPGHFDLRPSQVRRLRESRLLLRFDFQDALDAWLDRDETTGPELATIAVRGGFGEPETYAAVCRQVADALTRRGQISPGDARRITAAIDRRMEQLDRWARRQIERVGLRDAAVLASDRQAGFCRGLGLKVAATFSAADTARTDQIDRAVQAGRQERVRLVVANRPEGRQLADALAQRLDVVVVVLDNFPDAEGPQAFDTMVRRNVTSLVQAVADTP